MATQILWNELIPMEDGRGFEAYHRSHRTLAVPEFHSHEFYEIYCYLTGTATLVIEGYEQPLKRGDLYIIPPGHMHRAVHADTSRRYERIFLYISRDCLRSMGNEGFDLLGILDGHAARRRYRFHLDEEELLAFVAQVDEVIQHSNSLNPADQLINRCRFNILLTRLGERFLMAADEEQMQPSSRIGQVIDYLNEHIAEDHRLDALAERFFVSKYYLLHEFRRHTNTSIYQYLLSKRVIYAKLLLQRGLSPGAVSRRCGFRDYSCFYKAFRKATSLSPQQYIGHMRRHGEGDVRSPAPSGISGWVAP